jgi:uncharacterized protein YgiM (DUF1202 family)
VKLRIVILPILAIMLVSACGPQRVERPLEGAPVGESARATADAVSVIGPPPTLVPPNVGAPAASPSPDAVALVSPSPSPVPGFVIVATDGRGANLRSAPSTSSSVITTLREGTPVAVLGDPVTREGREWREIESGSQRGWVVAVVVRAR